MTPSSYHSGLFSSIENALQQGGINPCFPLLQTVEDHRSGIFQTGFSHCFLSPDLQLPVVSASAVAGGRLFGAPLAVPGFLAYASPSCPAMARPDFLYAAAGSQLGSEERFYLGWIRGAGSPGGQLPPGSWRWFLSGLGLALGRWFRGRGRV